MKTILKRIEELLIALKEEWQKGAGNRLEPEHLHAADLWLRADEVMGILKICRRTLYSYQTEGAFDTRRMGGTRFYSRASVMRLK
ncbi:MAG TPA: hypothetical protein VKB19_06050 [Pedobacter sp.]|nr:hypothetical protein [Pedobacter sp.]